MSTEIVFRAPVQLLVVECQRSNDGFYYHTAFEGRKKIISAGFDRTLNSDSCEEMRKAPAMYIAWCRRP
jgi:hypothetical protein